jgi:hypothetical protein
MTLNEAPWDRILRITIGIALLSLTLVEPRTYWGLLGLVPLVTGTLGVCPLYRFLGVSTCPVTH